MLSTNNARWQRRAVIRHKRQPPGGASLSYALRANNAKQLIGGINIAGTIAVNVCAQQHQAYGHHAARRASSQSDNGTSGSSISIEKT